MNQNIPGIPLSFIAAHLLVFRELFKAVRHLIGTGRHRRSQETVRQVYDEGVSKREYIKKKWLGSERLEDYLCPSTGKTQIAKIQNRLMRVEDRDYCHYRIAMLRHIMQMYAGTERQLVEVGCGTGKNLFALALFPTWDILYGLDVSRHGILAAKEVKDHFGLARIAFGQIDLTKADDPAFAFLRDTTVFTYYCMEQLKYDTAHVIENFIRAGVKRVIHIEPTAEVLKLYRPMDLLNYLYIIRKDYQDNLLKTLRRFEKRQVITIKEVRRLFYAPAIRHDPALIVWEPVAQNV